MDVGFLRKFLASFILSFALTFICIEYIHYENIDHVISSSMKAVTDKMSSFHISKTSSSRHHISAGATIAEKMHSKVRILCLVLTYPKSHYAKAAHVNTTWGQNCNGLKFMTTKEEDDLPTIALPISETYEGLWNKTKASLRWAYDNHLEDYDWFFKADDDTYAVLENLRYVLSFYDSNKPWLFGSRFRFFTKDGYMSGAGYLVSRAGVKLLVENGFDNQSICRTGINEDLEMGVCMSALNASFGDSRDQFNRWRFFPIEIEKFFSPTLLPQTHWLRRYAYYRIILDMNCCSDTATLTHKIIPEKMHYYHYLLYHLRAIGMTKFPLHFPKLLFQ